MPRLPALRTRVLQELARQLRYESPDAARRQLERAEELAAQLLAESAPTAGPSVPDGYPEDWVIFRITGLRMDAPASKGGDGESGGVVVREALLGDLPALVDRLSAAAHLTPEDLSPRAKKPPTSWLGAPELCARWNVSRKTLDRYRRLGLVSRRIGLGRGRERVMYSEACVRAFERIHGPRVRDAGTFTRMDARTLARIVRRAAQYRRRFGWTLHRCARRIAAREGRSVETIRQALRRHDRTLPKPLFDEPGPIDAEQSAWIERTGRRGGNMSGAAARVRKDRSTVYRVVDTRRAERLRELDLRGPIGPTFMRRDAEEVLLGHAAASQGLGKAGATNIGALVRMAASIEPTTAPHESARSAAYWYLLWSCARAIEALPRHGAPVRSDKQAGTLGLDAVETRLLWASRLKAEMVRAELPLLLRTIEAQTDRRLAAIPAVVLTELFTLGLEALIEAADRFDPFKGGRLAAPVGIGLTRAISQWLRAHRDRLGAPGRAAARIDMDQLPLEDWARRVHPWQSWLEPPAGVRAHLDKLDEHERRMLEARFGWRGSPPQTLDQTAQALSTTPTRIAGMQRKLIARLAHGASPARKPRKRRS